MALLGILSLLLVLTLSLLVTRVATAALVFTGLSREMARFQARSAFSGVGFTTSEAEQVVNHPVRRRIVMLLMLLGNAGIVTLVSTLILSFVDAGQMSDVLPRLGGLAVGVALLWTVASSRWVDQQLSRLVHWALGRWTSLEVRDYASLLHLASNHAVVELAVEPGDWLAGRSLGALALNEEGVVVLGLQRTNGDYIGAPEDSTAVRPGDRLILYGRSARLARIDQRRADGAGEACRREGIAEQQRVLATQPS